MYSFKNQKNLKSVYGRKSRRKRPMPPSSPLAIALEKPLYSAGGFEALFGGKIIK